MNDSLAYDLGDVFDEIGTLVEIYGSKPVIRERIDIEQNVQISNPFIREHFIEGTLRAHTKIKPGDVITVLTTKIPYLVVNYSHEMFENEAVVITTTLYKCNVVATIQRVKEETRDAVTRQKTIVWETIATIPAPISSALRGGVSDMNDLQPFVQFITKEKLMYFSEQNAPKSLDRIVLPSGQYFKVTNAEYYRFNNVVVCALEEDTRA